MKNGKKNKNNMIKPLLFSNQLNKLYLNQLNNLSCRKIKLKELSLLKLLQSYNQPKNNISKENLGHTCSKY